MYVQKYRQVSVLKAYSHEKWANFHRDGKKFVINTPFFISKKHMKDFLKNEQTRQYFVQPCIG